MNDIAPMQPSWVVPEFNLDSALGDCHCAEGIPAEWTNYTIDPRIALMSYSDRAILHSCPRRYQLSKISKQGKLREENGTLAFGQVVGIGIQSTLEGKSWPRIVLDMLMGWELADIYATEPLRKKGFFEAVFAIQQFQTVRNTVLADYDLAYFDGKSACEFAFKIHVIGEIKYRSKIDAVLRHRVTGKLLVLEDKTTYYTTVNESSYGNSSQATGYSIVLDTLDSGNSEYDVMYLVYKTTVQEFEVLMFTKHFSDRAIWIKELLMDCELIQLYENTGHYPCYGESCRDFGRDCEFYGTCKMSTAALSLPFDPANNNLTARYEAGYNVEFNLLDLIDAQLTREE